MKLAEWQKTVTLFNFRTLTAPDALECDVCGGPLETDLNCLMMTAPMKGSCWCVSCGFKGVRKIVRAEIRSLCLGPSAEIEPKGALDNLESKK